jgi:hypothetical protein
MTNKKLAKKPTNIPLTMGVNQERLALALAFAGQFGSGAAAKQFKVSQRSIVRYSGRLANGELPDLAKLVDEAKIELRKTLINQNLRQDVMDAHYRRLLLLAETATHTQATTLVNQFRELDITEKSLSNGGSNNPDQGAAGQNPSVAVNTGPTYIINKPEE